MNAVIYARFSSHNQTEQSIEGQLRVCYEYAQREGIGVVGEYIDRAISARSANRPDFQRMIKDARKKAFDYVLVYKLDRFARNRYDSAMYRHELKKHGVKVLSASEGIGDNPESIILEAMLEASAEYYSVELAQKVMRGMRESAIKRQFIGGRVPLGYVVENKHLEIDERTASTVRRIFEEYVAGRSMREITKDLNEDGLRSSRNKEFTYNSIARILSNDTYIGTYRWKEIVAEDAVPAIIDKKTYELARARTKANKRRPGAKTKKEKYLLAGKLFCGHCGAPMNGGYGTSRDGTRHTYYVCATRKKKSACDKSHEKRGFVEWFVVEKTLAYVLSPNVIDGVAERVVAQYNSDINSSKIAELERGIREIDKEMDVLIEMMSKMASQKGREKSEERFALLEAQQNELQTDLSKLIVANNARITKQQVLAWLKLFCHGDPLDEKFREKIIDVLVRCVYVYDDRFEIYYNIKGGEENFLIDSPDPLEDAEHVDVRSLYSSPHHIVQRSNNPFYVFQHGLFGLFSLSPSRWLFSLRYDILCKMEKTRGAIWQHAMISGDLTTRYQDA